MSSTALDDNTKKSSSSSTRFDAPGLNFKAKLIGSEEVAKSRGHKMCQVAMAKAKAAVLAIGEHKMKITVNVSIDGIKIMDEKAEVVLHRHPVHKVSFISRDANDPRAFGYVFNGENGGHQFVGIKTEKAAEPLVLTLRDLFQTMVGLKQEREREAAKNKANAETSENELKEENKKNQTEEMQDDEKTHPMSMDLLGFDPGPEQFDDIQQLDPLTSGNTSTFSAWPSNNSQFQNTMSGAVVGLPGSSPQVPGIAMASSVYHQQHAYHRSIPRMQNSTFGGFHHPNAFPAQAWPQAPALNSAQAPASLLLNPSTSTSGGSSTSGGLLQPTSAKPIVASDPLPPSTPTKTTKYPDPFADLAVIPPQGQQRPGRKASKEDFIKEAPKQSLLDISRQQQQQQHQPGSTRLDPSSPGVSPPNPRELHSPLLAEGQKTPSYITNHPASPSPSHTLDNNQSFVASFQAPEGGKVDRDPLTPGSSSTSRPRPKGSAAAARPGSLVPLPAKVTPKLLCTCALEELHAKRYSRNTLIDTKLFNKSTSHCTHCTHCTPPDRTRRFQVKLSQSSAPDGGNDNGNGNGSGNDNGNGNGNGNGSGNGNGKSLQTEVGGDEYSNDSEGKSFEMLWTEMSKNKDDLIGNNNAWLSPKFSSDDDELAFDAESSTRQNNEKMFGMADHYDLSVDQSQDASVVIRNSNFSETSGEDSGSGSRLSADRIPPEEEESVLFRCDVFFGDSFYYDENISADINTDYCDSITGADATAGEGGVTLSDGSSYRKPAPDSRPGPNRRVSARRTRSLSGLITIREETDSNSDGRVVRQRSRVEETESPSSKRDTVAWIPDAAQRCHGNDPFSPVDSSWAYPGGGGGVGGGGGGGGGNPFPDVDPFFDEFASSFPADPFEGQVKGQAVDREVIDLFDVCTETPETFNTRAVTFDF